MRKGCNECTYKHLASAAILDDERKLGYPEFLLYVIGNLDQAAIEAQEVNPELANTIRCHRLKLWNGFNDYKVPFEALGVYLLLISQLPTGATLPEIPENCKVQAT